MVEVDFLVRYSEDTDTPFLEIHLRHALKKLFPWIPAATINGRLVTPMCFCKSTYYKVEVLTTADYRDYILGYKISTGTNLHFVYVRKEFRNKKLSRKLLDGEISYSLPYSYVDYQYAFLHHYGIRIFRGDMLLPREPIDRSWVGSSDKIQRND